MKTLFVGCHRDGTRGGRLAQQLLLGLDTAGVDVAARPLCYQFSNLYSVPNRVAELEKKSLDKYDNTFQCMPYRMLDINRGYGIPNYVHEFIEKDQNKSKYITLADRVLPDTYARQSFYDGAIYDSPIPENLKFLQDSFVFYVIGKLHNSQHWKSIIHAFQSNFSKKDDVSLVFKVTGNPEEVNAYFEKTVSEVHSELTHKYVNTGSFKSPIVICDALKECDLVGLHKVGDVFIYDRSPDSMWVDSQILNSERYPSQGLLNKKLQEFMQEIFQAGKKEQKVNAELIDHKYAKLGKSLVEKMNE